jgi:hypothetical protein
MKGETRMIIDLAKVSYDGRWYDFGGARLKIRPFPLSKSDVLVKEGAVVISGDEVCEMFQYCLVEWEGVLDAVGQALKLTEEVKKKIYDFKLGIVDGLAMSGFVLNTARALTDEIGISAKN